MGVLIFITLGIVAKAKPKADPLLVKAQVAVKIKSGSTDPSYPFNGRSVRSQDPSGKTGGKGSISRDDTNVECEKKAEYKEVAGKVYNYCPKKGLANKPDNEETGNYVQAVFDKSKNNLKVIVVAAYICDPKPDGCNCKTLLGKVVESHKTASKMSLLFAAPPAMAGCKCYLGTAARNGFKSVEVKKCEEKAIDFDENNYAKKCEALIGRADRCWASWWYIKK